MKNNRLRRLMAGLFAFSVMTTSVFSTNTFIAYGETGNSSIDVSKAHSLSRSEKTILSTMVDSEANNQLNLLYKATDDVTIIVELEDKPILDYYSADSTSNSASSFVASSKGQEITKSLLKEQKNVTTRILDKVSATIEQEYTVVMNGFALTAKYGDLETIKSIKGVKNAFVSTVHYLPNPEIGYEPTMSYSGTTIGSTIANESGYTGKNTVVAVLDTGLDIEHEGFKANPESVKYSETQISEIMTSNKMTAKGNVYKSAKLPFTYDYADKDENVSDPKGHGTHVAGTIGANGGEVTGVAPDAQLMIMKVFSDNSNGAKDSDILAALDDAVALGANTINMSLGSSAGFTESAYEVVNETYNRVTTSGINLLCAAGNDYSSTYNSNLGTNLPLVSNPDNSIVGSPSTYSSATSVASINNSKVTSSYLLVGETKIRYADPNEGTDKVFNSLEGNSGEYVVVPGVGTEEDFKSVDVKGKIALVQRGEIAFTDKETNANTAGAIGLIIYDNVIGDLVSMNTDEKIPMIFISKEHGEILVEQSTKTVSISESYKGAFDSLTGGQMSDFSSWGVSPDLKLKPEITAPGGDIYSTLPGGAYGSMSGTSMACPHMAGAAALVRQYIDEEFKSITIKEKEELAFQLLMSTAIKAIDPNGVPYSPRKQGAGVANVYNSIKTGGYLIGENGKPKAELGDSLTGEYSLNFDVKNISNAPLSYTVDTTVLTEKILESEEGKFFAQASEELDSSKVTVTLSGVDGNDIIVEPGNTETITVSLKLTDNEKEALKVCENGTFIDGFVTLVSKNEDKIDLNIPFVGFYGDWGAVPLFDNEIYDNEDAAMYETALAYFNNTTGKGSYLGVNMFNGKDNPRIAGEDKIAIGGNLDGTSAVSAVVGLLRNVEELTYSVTDSTGKEVYKQTEGKENKSFYNGTTGRITNAIDNHGWDAMNSNKPFEDGVYTYKISGTPVGSNEKDLQEVALPITIDTELPELINTKIETVDDVKYLVVTLKDNHYLQAMQLQDEEGNTITKIIPLDSDKKGAEYEEIFKLDDLGVEAVKVIAIDYAKNLLSTNPIALVEGEIDVKSVTLNNKNLTLAEESEFQMTASINPYNAKDKTLTWSSSNEEVATISETGNVKALTAGETTITVSTVNEKIDSTTLTVVNKDDFAVELKAPYVIHEDGNYKLPANLSKQTIIVKDTANKVCIVGDRENTASNPYNSVDVSCEGNVNLTINNLNTNVTSFLKNGIEFKGDKNTLVLRGENTLTSTADYSDRGIISAAYGTELDISGEGTLNIIAAKNNYGACIGGGSSTDVMDSGTINISGGTINVTTHGAGSAIGGANSGIATDINISGGKVTAISDVRSYIGSATIGSGASAENVDKISGSIKVTGGEVIARSTGQGAVIGDCSNGNTDYNILISDGHVNAESTSTSTYSAGAAIGAGSKSKGAISIKISGGVVYATNPSAGAAIGGAYGSSEGIINIEGGTITATSINSGAAIGNGYSGKKQNITILKGTVKATATGGGQSIGKGEDAEDCTLTGMNGKTPYQATILSPNVTSVKVDGEDWNITKGHEEDENIYLYLVEKAEPYRVTVLAGDKVIDYLVKIGTDGNVIVEEADFTPPSVPVITDKDGVVTLTAADEDTAKMEYSLDNETWVTYTEPVTLAEKATIYVRAIDEAGNISEVSNYTVPDRTAPAVPVLNEENGVVTLVADEDTVKMEYRLDNKTWVTYTEPVTVAEKATIYVRAIDEVGNISGVLTYTVPDRTAPAAPHVAEANGTVTLTAADDDTSKMEYSLDNKTWVTYIEPVEIAEKATIYVKAIDKSGNISGVVSYTVPDRTAPVAPVTSEESGVVTLTVADEDTVKMEYSLDNETWVTYTEPVTVAEKVTIYVRAIDEAGNVSEASSYTVLDKTAPKAPAITEGNGKVTLTAVDEDTLKMEYSLDNKTWVTYTEPVEVAEKATIYMRAIDEAGNVSEASRYTVPDRTAPKAPAIAEAKGIVTLTAADKDTVKIEYSLDNKIWVTYTEPVEVAEKATIYVRAIDEAGNTSKVAEYKMPEKEKPSTEKPNKPSNPSKPSKPSKPGKNLPQTGGMFGSEVLALGGIITFGIGALALKRKK